MDKEGHNELINAIIEMEYIPSVHDEEINTEKYIKFPLSKLSTLGVGFSNLFEYTRTITQSINANG